MIDLIISATVGAIAGFGICAVLTVGKVSDLDQQLADAEANTAASLATYNRMFAARSEAVSAHTRLSDALATKQARIDRALACETPKAAHGVKKMARLLRGEEA